MNKEVRLLYSHYFINNQEQRSYIEYELASYYYNSYILNFIVIDTTLFENIQYMVDFMYNTQA